MPLQFLWSGKYDFYSQRQQWREEKNVQYSAKNKNPADWKCMCISEGFVKIILRYWLHLHKNNAIWSWSQAFNMFEIKQYRFDLATKQFLWGELEAVRSVLQQTSSLYPSAHLCPRWINSVSSPHHRRQPHKARSGRCGLVTEYQLPREKMFAQWEHECSSHSAGVTSVLTDLVGTSLFLRLLPFHHICI